MKNVLVEIHRVLGEERGSFMAKRWLLEELGEPFNWSAAVVAHDHAPVNRSHPELAYKSVIISTPASGGLPFVVAIEDDQEQALRMTVNLMVEDLSYWNNLDRYVDFSSSSEEELDEVTEYRDNCIAHYLELLDWIIEDMGRLGIVQRKDEDEALQRGG